MSQLVDTEDDTSETTIVEGEELPIIVKGVVFKCPFCGGGVKAGATAEDEDVVLHDMPPCIKYLDLPIDVYLYRCRMTFLGNPS